MEILLTNDDGIDAAGLEALRASLDALEGSHVHVVAPSRQVSQCGHAVTTHEPLRVHEVGLRRYAVEGSPADCVRVALHGLRIEPDLVLSGINFGGNLGADLPISGTAAAAREAAFHGLRAAAVSHYHKKSLPMDWARAQSWASRVLIEHVLNGRWTPGTFWNVNFPHLSESDDEPEIVETQVCRNPLPASFESAGDGLWRYTGVYSDRQREPGSDVDVCFSGAISISKVPI